MQRYATTGKKEAEGGEGGRDRRTSAPSHFLPPPPPPPSGANGIEADSAGGGGGEKGERERRRPKKPLLVRGRTAGRTLAQEWVFVWAATIYILHSTIRRAVAATDDGVFLATPLTVTNVLSSFIPTFSNFLTGTRKGGRSPLWATRGFPPWQQHLMSHSLLKCPPPLPRGSSIWLLLLRLSP